MMNMLSRRMLVTLLLLVVGAGTSLAAQKAKAEATPEPLTLEERVAALEEKAKADRVAYQAEIDQLRKELKDRQEGDEDRLLARRRKLRVYGDVSIRWFMLDSNGSRATIAGEGSQINRPEYRARLGVTGFLLDEFKHRTKYNIRISNQGFAEYDAPLGAPAVSYRPFEAYGSTTSAQIDRLWIRHAYKRWLYLGLGRWQTPLRTTEMLFDRDVGFTGLWTSIDLGRLSKAYETSDFEDWRDFGNAGDGFSRLFLTGAAYYMAQDSIGVPQKRGESVPHGFSLQLAGKYRFGDYDPSFVFGLGVHYFNGEEGIAANVGTGNTVSTTNRVDANGDVDASFRLLDMLLEAYFFEDQSASLKAYVHVIRNFGAEEEDVLGASDYSWGLMGGVQWGALQVEEAKEFQIRYSLFYVEPDALIPEFNHEEVNTNFKGQRLSVVVALASGLIATSGVSYGKRVEEGLMGIGRQANGNAGSPSDDYEMRIYLGFGLRF